MPIAPRTWSIGTYTKPRKVPFRKCGASLCILPAVYELTNLNGDRMVVCREHEEINFVLWLRKAAGDNIHGG